MDFESSGSVRPRCHALPPVIPRVRWVPIWLAFCWSPASLFELARELYLRWTLPAPARLVLNVYLFFYPIYSGQPLRHGEAREGLVGSGYNGWADRLSWEGAYSVRYINNNLNLGVNLVSGRAVYVKI